MDTFDEFSLECFIQKRKDKIIDTLNKLNLNSQSLSKNNDLLCLVLDQTPNIQEDTQPSLIYQISQSSNSHFQSKATLNIILECEPKHPSGVSAYSSQSKSNVNENMKDNSKPEDDSIMNTNSKQQIEEIVRGIIFRIISNVPLKQQRTDNNSTEYNDKKTPQTPISTREVIIDKPSLTYNGKIRVYLFNTNNYIDIDVLQDDSFRIIKKKIYSKLLNSVNLITQLREVEGYEFISMEEREEGNDNELPKCGKLLIKDTQKVFGYGKDAIGFVEKVDYINTSKPLIEKAKLNVVGNVLSKSESSKINLRVHIKIEEKNSHSTVIQANSEVSLKTIMEKIRSRLILKNMDYYYFVEHSPYFDNEDIEKSLSFDLLLKYLSTYEIDLFMKKYPDMPELYDLARQSVTSIEIKLIDKKKLAIDLDQVIHYNDISAAAYEEFDVVKINKYQSKQERTLGIDLYNLYNDVPKKSRSKQFLGIGKTKKTLRKICDILKCGIVGENSFFIDENENGSMRRLIFESKNVNLRNQIVSKLNYLLKMNQRK